MKYIITILVRFFTVRLITKSVIIGGMGLSLTDSSAFFWSLYRSWLEVLGIIFLLFSFYTFLYIIKSRNLRFPNRQVRAYYFILKALLYLVLIAPVIIDGNWKFHFTFSFQDREEFKAVFELVKVIGMELLMELYFSLTKEQKI